MGNLHNSENLLKMRVMNPNALFSQPEKTADSKSLLQQDYSWISQLWGGQCKEFNQMKSLRKLSQDWPHFKATGYKFGASHDLPPFSQFFRMFKELTKVFYYNESSITMKWYKLEPAKTRDHTVKCGRDPNVKLLVILSPWRENGILPLFL